ncbi:hypothetical protein ACP70R_042993 [Stipagrostis hirtigluma subsp. patula]
MSMRSRAARFLALLCFWTAVLTAIGAVAGAGRDPSYCESPNPPGKPPEGSCPPPQR